MVKEAQHVESAERLLGVDAHATTETRRMLLPVNALNGFGHEGSGEAVLADLWHAWDTVTVQWSPRRLKDLQMWAVGAEMDGNRGRMVRLQKQLIGLKA